MQWTVLGSSFNFTLLCLRQVLFGLWSEVVKPSVCFVSKFLVSNCEEIFSFSHCRLGSTNTCLYWGSMVPALSRTRASQTNIRGQNRMRSARLLTKWTDRTMNEVRVIKNSSIKSSLSLWISPKRSNTHFRIVQTLLWVLASDPDHRFWSENSRIISRTRLPKGRCLCWSNWANALNIRDWKKRRCSWEERTMSAGYTSGDKSESKVEGSG